MGHCGKELHDIKTLRFKLGRFAKDELDNNISMKSHNKMRKIIALFTLTILLAACGEKPEADFTWSPSSPKAGQEVKFTNLSSDAKKYSWNFGDMSIGSDENPTHIYNSAGNYIVDLTATSGARSDTKTVTIKVKQ
jgi:PKD repeat protein